ncbi:hypothetical protein EGW08_017755, partial [Elysia chlorotica]
MKMKPCKFVPLVKRKYHTENFYMVDYADKTTIQFSCLTNFHLVSGDLRWTCLENGKWSGSEPLCAVDYLKDKWTLSGIIVLVSFFIPMLWLCTDFYCFVKKRTRVRNTRYTIGPLSDMRKNEKLLGQIHATKRIMSYNFETGSISWTMLSSTEDDQAEQRQHNEYEEFFRRKSHSIKSKTHDQDAKAQARRF